MPEYRNQIADCNVKKLRQHYAIQRSIIRISDKKHWKSELDFMKKQINISKQYGRLHDSYDLLGALIPVCCYVFRIIIRESQLQS